MLTNATVKGARPAARPYKMFDAGGLHLLVRPNGTKTFRLKYRREGKEQLLTFGTWPELSLHQARIRHEFVREQLRRGVAIKVNRAANDELDTFESLARRWHERRRSRWSAEHANDVLRSLERDVFPAIGGIAPGSIDATSVLELLLQVEARGRIETARRLRERISGIFRLGISMKLCAADPAALISDELSPRPVQRPQAALTELEEARELLAACELVDLSRVVKLASRLLALTAVRLAALRGAAWSEIEDLDGPLPRWRIPPARMKLTKVKKADPSAEHVVYLSRQAVALLRELRELTGPSTMLGTGSGGLLLFPGRRRGRPIGEGAIGDLYDRAGFGGRHVPHGWRATFSTTLNDRFPADQALIDQALAHAGHKGKVEAAYNRARHIQRTRDLVQSWADLLLPMDG